MPITLKNGVLTIVGTEKKDFIQIIEYPQFIGAKDGILKNFVYFPIQDVTKIIVKAGAKSDTVICNTKIPCEIYGGSGDDFLLGGYSNDKIYGGPGEDDMGSASTLGSNGNTVFNGNDLYVGGPGNDDVSDDGSISSTNNDGLSDRNQEDNEDNFNNKLYDIDNN